jgi:predicted Rossmann fold flavoprotein
MAAGQASIPGADVIIFEKKNRPAIKLGITGKGRCNLTNKAPLDEFLARYGPQGKFLRPAFSRFFSGDLIKFLKSLGIKTDFERGGRVFPVSGDACAVAEALLSWVRAKQVKIVTNARVRKLIVADNRVTGLAYSRDAGDKKTEEYFADRVILATGGASYPATGSTGDGYRLAESVGHSIVPIRPALVPLETKGDIAPRLQGLSLKNVKLAVYADGRKRGEIFGEMLFTHFGISGPIVLTISKLVVDLISQKKQVTISLDLKPALDDKKLDNRLLRDFDSHGHKSFKSVLKLLLPRKLIPVCMDLTRMQGETLCNQISSGERKRLRMWLKDFRLDISKARPLSEAIVTAGGINLKEIDPGTMESRLVNNLYFAGEVLDIDADTGGFNLQAAFSTGYLAGISASPRA